MPKITNWSIDETVTGGRIVYKAWQNDITPTRVVVEMDTEDKTPSDTAVRLYWDDGSEEKLLYHCDSSEDAKEKAREWMKSHRFGTPGDSHLSTLIKRVLGATPEHALWGQFKQNLREYPSEWSDYSDFELAMREWVREELRKGNLKGEA